MPQPNDFVKRVNHADCVVFHVERECIITLILETEGGFLMGADVMGRVVVEAKIENLEDAYRVARGELAAEEARQIVVAKSLVDTGATTLCLPRPLIDALGLRLRRTRPMQTAGGLREVGLYDAVRLTILDRDCVVDVSELPAECPVLVGQVPLELMDWVVDPRGQQLIGNPAHDGKWMGEIY